MTASALFPKSVIFAIIVEADSLFYRRVRMKRFAWLIPLAILVLSIPLASCTSSGTAKITVATDATWPPFEYVNEQTKNIEGFDIDIMNAIAAKENLNIEFKNVSWDPLLAGMAQGTYDMAISSITITDSRKKDMLFSDPYFAAGQLVVVRKDNTTITGKDSLNGNIGVQLGTTGDLEVQKIKAATSKPYDDIGLAFQDLMNGQVNAVVCDNPVALLYVGQNPDKLKSVGTVFTDENYGIAVAKGKSDLLTKVNAGLKAVMAEGLIDKTAKTWLK
jgi:polar amino acid transport system substrate-binding protein